MKATPAPWKKMFTGIGSEYRWTIFAKHRNICETMSVFNPTSDERKENDDNAELIMKSCYIPEMVELMKKTVNEWEDFYEEARKLMPQAPHRETMSPPSFVEEIKKLIEKVEQV
jgi:hypothetical protein